MDKPNKILLIDDADYFLKMKEGFLKRSDCIILKAASGEEGLALAREHRPSLAIIDFSMPGMKGDDCCRAIKADPDLKGIPVIMTANGWEKEAQERCSQAGCDDFMSKPINRQRFQAGIRQFIRIVERAHTRIPCDGEVSFASNGHRYEGLLEDVSEGGIFIKREGAPLAVGAGLKASFRLGRLGETIEAEGRVVRVVNGNRPPGMGVQFYGLPDGVRLKIRNFGLVKGTLT